MRRGCLVAFALVLALIGGMTLFLWLKRDAIVAGVKSVFELPDHGKKEFIVSKHGDLITDLNKAATESSSLFQFGAAIEDLSLPEEVVFIGIVKGDDTTPVIKNFEWNGRSFRISNGYGAGTLSGGGQTKTIMIHQNSGRWDYMDSFVVYFEYKETAPE